MTDSAATAFELARSTSITCSTQMERFSGKPFHPDGTLLIPEAGRKVWYGRIEGVSLMEPGLHSDSKVILGILSLKTRGNMATFGMRELGKAINKSPQTVMRRLLELVAHGDIEIIHGKNGHRAQYRLTAPMFDAKLKKARAKPAPKPMLVCNGCGAERPGLMRTGFCRGCSSRKTIKRMVKETVVEELGRSA